MGLLAHLAVIRRQWWVVVALTLLGAGAAQTSTALTPATFTASAQVYVSTQGATGSVTELVQGSNYTRQQIATYAGLATTPLVLDQAAEILGAPTTAASLHGVVSSTLATDTSLITITARSRDAAEAARVANAVASAFGTQVEDIEKPRTGGAAPVKVTLVSPAATPRTPTSPRPTTDLALGLLIGVGVGVGAVVLRERLDTKVRTEEDAGRLVGTTVLGTVVVDPHRKDAPLVVRDEPLGVQAEGYRQLRTAFQFATAAVDARSAVVTSSVPAEGKSTIAMNLAQALAETGSRVLLVDADLRRPRLATALGLEGAAGLTSLLVGRARLEEVVQTVGSAGHLDVLCSGVLPRNPSELLGSQAMRRLVQSMTAAYDVVLFDAPPLLPVTDAAVLAGQVDGVLLTVGEGRVVGPQLAKSVATLASLGHVLGAIMTTSRPTRGRAGGNYYGTYHTRQSDHPDLDDPDVLPALPVMPVDADGLVEAGAHTGSNSANRHEVPQA